MIGITVDAGDHFKKRAAIPLAPCISVLRIRIHQIHMFLGLLDPDPSVRGIWFLLSPGKKSKKNLDSYCFVTSF
jgi:hypothetical protein